MGSDELTLLIKDTARVGGIECQGRESHESAIDVSMASPSSVVQRAGLDLHSLKHDEASFVGEDLAFITLLQLCNTVCASSQDQHDSGNEKVGKEVEATWEWWIGRVYLSGWLLGAATHAATVMQDPVDDEDDEEEQCGDLEDETGNGNVDTEFVLITRG